MTAAPKDSASPETVNAAVIAGAAACSGVKTIADSIAEYKATRNSSAVKLLHKVLDKIIGLKCPHCHGDVNITIE